MKISARDAKKWARSLSGHIATTTTPFTKDLEIDENGHRENIRRLLALPSVKGIYVNSVFQESPALSRAERVQVCKVAVSAVGPDVPVICVASGTVVRDVVDLAQDAQAVGAAALMLWPPTFGFRTADGVLSFLRTVAQSVDMPVCIYVSGLSEFGYKVSLPMLRQLAEIPQVCAVKEASLSLGTYLETLAGIGDRLVVSSPLDEWWAVGQRLMPGVAPNVLLGTSRALYMENERRTYISDVYESVRKGEASAIERSLGHLAALANQLHNRFLEGGMHNVALTKALSAFMGFKAGPVRPPMSAPSKEAVDEGARIMREAGLIS
jgi:dihydrodipicolinate synthase/N-acetylneuraminate lyase